MGRACPALRGQPAGAKLASTSIGELFGGDIAAYLADLDFGPGALFGGVRNLLDGQVQRLSALEHDVLRWFAIEREPISFSELGESLASSFSRRDIREAVEALLRRSLLERHEASDAPRFALHPSCWSTSVTVWQLKWPKKSPWNGSPHCAHARS